MKEFFVRLGWLYYTKHTKHWIYTFSWLALLIIASLLTIIFKIRLIFPVLYFWVLLDIVGSWFSKPVRNYKVADVEAKETLERLFFSGRYNLYLDKISAMRDESSATHNSKQLGKWLNKFDKLQKTNRKILNGRHKINPNLKRLTGLNRKLNELHAELFEGL